MGAIDARAAGAGDGAWLPQETLRRKRDGLALSAEEIARVVDGIARGRLAEAQVGAFAMAVLWRGMTRAETVALTQAMADSGARWQWPDDGRPCLDKHSTGGIGDNVSLILGPLLAACGARVPMVSGRGLGHTGGTLDKLESIPGYGVRPPRARLRRVLADAGVAIVGAGPNLAPADRRLYAVRDVTATVESPALIVASILSKKLAAGLDALVLDVKFGNGAFLPDPVEARALAQALVDVAEGAGLPTRAWLTDMDEPLAPCAGNAIELRQALAALKGAPPAQWPRLHAVVMALGATALCQGGLAPTPEAARARLQQALQSGAAAERFARMVHGLGGPADLLEAPAQHLAVAPVQRPVPAPHAGVVAAIDTRALGLAVVQLGGGRRRPADRIDPAVGLDALLPRGVAVPTGAPLAMVHAADAASADAAVQAVRQAYRLSDDPAAAHPPRPPVAEAIAPQADRPHRPETSP